MTTVALGSLTRELTRRGFEWGLPVVLSRSTDPLWPDPGASIEQRVELEVYGASVRTTQSMIVHKLVACSLLYPRYFVLSPNIRIERRARAATGRHLYEFTQLDFEVCNASSADIRRLVEVVIRRTIRALRGSLPSLFAAVDCDERLRIPASPFPRYDHAALRDRYGESWEEEFTKSIRSPAWVTNIPREFYDFEDPETGVWDNYDLFAPGYGEILSGARREWKHARLAAKIRRDGVGRRNYAILLALARDGRLRPSAGGGLGIERFLAWLSGARHIGEVQPFPRVPGRVTEL